MFQSLYSGIVADVREASTFRNREKSYLVKFTNGVEIHTEPNLTQVLDFIPYTKKTGFAGLAGYSVQWKILVELNHLSQISKVLQFEESRIGIPMR